MKTPVWIGLAAVVLLGAPGLWLWLVFSGGPRVADAKTGLSHEPGKVGSVSGGSPDSFQESRGPAPKSGTRPPRNPAGKIFTTPSGLEYTILREGSGPRPGPTDRVRVDYTGTTEHGEIFDSTAERGPNTFPLDGVIQGWKEGLQLMDVGSKFRFVIPPALAYGEKGRPGTIEPNATLVFEVELLGIEDPVPKK